MAEDHSGGSTGLGWQFAELAADYDYLAPDGSEIRQLVELDRANLAHFRLPTGATSAPVAHRTIEEFWYVVGGQGEMWLKLGNDQEDVVDLFPGVAIALPPGTHFQFRTTGPDALEVIGTAVPAWPGPDEAYAVDGRWPAGRGLRPVPGPTDRDRDGD